jgi:ABC-type lipopolysaccharide export system ATPase subunit
MATPETTTMPNNVFLQTWEFENFRDEVFNSNLQNDDTQREAVLEALHHKPLYLIQGPPGAGKTTVFYMITGLVPADQGQIHLDGFDITALPMYRRARLGIGYLPQEPQMDPAQTVRQAVEEGIGGVLAAKKRLDEVYAEYAEPDADFDKLAEEQAALEALIAGGGGSGGAEHQL